MKTSVIVSNITWNTVPFFQSTLSQLIQEGVVDWFHAIEHKAESSEKKSHIHFCLQPSKALDLNWLAMRLSEFVVGEELPRKPTSEWRKLNSKTLSDWLLYALHDRAYLSRKLKSKAFHYSLDDFITSDRNALEGLFEEAQDIDGGLVVRLRKAFESGLSLSEVLLSGAIPLSLFRSARDCWGLLEASKQVKKSED